MWPGAYDNFSNPASDSNQSVLPHHSQHANANDAIEAIEQALGNTAVGGKLFNGEFWISAASMWPTLTSGASGQALAETSTNKNNIWAVDFLTGVSSRAEATYIMPSDWDGGTITCKFYWSVPGSSTVAVTWQVQARGYGDGSTLDATSGTAVTVNDAGSGTASQLRISAATAAVTVAGSTAAGSMVQFRFSRRGDTDSMPSTARLRGVLVSYGRS